ncbi:MAG: LytTR family DNA-binding domain-containing protein [Acidobacteriota bacterium]
MEKLLFKVGKTYLFVKKSDIDLIKADRNYVKVYCRNRSFVIRNTLQSIEKKLDAEMFLRINRSTIVNVDKINQLKGMENNNYFVILHNNEILPWGRKYRKNLVKLIKL